MGEIERGAKIDIKKLLALILIILLWIVGFIVGIPIVLSSAVILMVLAGFVVVLAVYTTLPKESQLRTVNKLFLIISTGIVFPIFAISMILISTLTIDPNTSKEFLKVVLEVDGVLFGIGGIFFTFILKNVYDVRDSYNKRIESPRVAPPTEGSMDLLEHRKDQLRPLINLVTFAIILFFLSSIASILTSSGLILVANILITNSVTEIPTWHLAIPFSCLIYSSILLFLTFIYQARSIEKIEHLELTPATPPESTEDESTEIESTEDESTEDESTEIESTEDESTA